MTIFNLFLVLLGMVLSLTSPTFLTASLVSNSSASKVESRADPKTFYLEADEIIYDQSTKTVIAKGNIHIRHYVPEAQGWRHVYAHHLKYESPESPFFNSLPQRGDQNKEKDKEKRKSSKKTLGKLTATGGVWLREPNGDLIHTDFLEFDDQFQDGLITSLSLLQSDESRLTAQQGIRSGGSISTFTQAYYSPCRQPNKGCVAEPYQSNQSKKPVGKPLWQLAAASITHDEAERTMTYRHVRLEIKGVPIFYLPYFSHPDPKVKRKSGLLFPIYGVSQDLGGILSLPVYYVITPNRDLTLTPILTTKEGGIVAGEYRHRFYNGDAKFAGSYKNHNFSKSSATAFNPSMTPKSDRWHLSGHLNYDLNDQQRLNLTLNRASDTTYLIRYPINRQTSNPLQAKNLTSQARFEHFGQQSYAGIRGLNFQTDTPKITPLVLPLAQAHHQFLPDGWGGTTTLEGNFLSLSRQAPVPGEQAKTMQRVSGRANWKCPTITPQGHLLTPRVSIRADGYHFQDYRPPSQPSSPANDRAKARLFPQASLDWRYPLITSTQDITWLLQPMVTLVASPFRCNQDQIPNEDSTIFELDETNLFLANRFQGLDRVDEGYRVIYGLDNTVLFPQRRSLSVWVGQSRRLDRRQAILGGLEEDKKNADYIARLKLKPLSWLTARYRVALKPDHYRPRYSEFGISLGKKYIKVDLGHIYLNKMANPKRQEVSQLNWQLTATVLENWSLSFGQVKNLKKTATRSSLANFCLLQYRDECFKFETGLYKTSYRDRDIRPDSGFLIQICFKNLGSFTPMTAPRYPGSMLTQF